MARKRSSYEDYYDGFFFEPSQPIETRDGLKSRSQRGAFVKNWWATRWIEALERLMDPGRLTRGRSYARHGQVLSIEETRGGIDARVQGSRPKPYKISLRMEPLSDAQWERVIDALAEQAIFTAQLLAGEMPQDIEEAFKSAGVSLFPSSGGDLTTGCSCPDWANPCKHVAAVHYILGERFDEDPFLLFRLRGRTQEQVLEALRKRRSGGEMAAEEDEELPEKAAPLEESLGRFWEMGASLEGFSVSIQPPAVEMPLLKRLGDPSFLAEPGLQALLRPAYLAISQGAIKAAFGDEEVDS